MENQYAVYNQTFGQLVCVGKGLEECERFIKSATGANCHIALLDNEGVWRLRGNAQAITLEGTELSVRRGPVAVIQSFSKEDEASITFRIDPNGKGQFVVILTGVHDDDHGQITAIVDDYDTAFGIATQLHEFGFGILDCATFQKNVSAICEEHDAKNF